MKSIGEAVSRIDGLLKVTGAAQYATDFRVPNAVAGFLIKSETAAGRVASVDSSVARKMPGVIDIITHENAVKLANPRVVRGSSVLQDAIVDFFGETIGIVVAETFEQARHAARFVKITYEKTAPRVDFKKEKSTAAAIASRADELRGDAEAALKSSDVVVDHQYFTPIEHHQPMAPHATTAIWEADDKLTVYNESQVVNGVQGALAGAFGLKPANVRVITPHIGGGFGSKGGAWGHVIVAAMAAKIVKRPVRLALTRQMMFNSVGLRQANYQRLALGATKDGKLTALVHETTTHTAMTEDFAEGCGDVSKVMYAVASSKITYRVAKMNIIVPTFNRAPGKSTGSFALECALDELAHKLKIDPVELRLRNEPSSDPTNGKPWSSRSLVQCLKEGAAAFGWSKRKMEPGSVREGRFLIGYGVGCGTYPSRQRDTSAILKLKLSGGDVTASVELAASDLGTGTYTILAQTAAEALGLPLTKIGVKIGDSNLPPAAGSVGSVGAASFANAVYEVCLKTRKELESKTDAQWFAQPTIAQLMEAAKIKEFETRVDAKPPADADKYSSHAFNANFAEVAVDSLTGMTRVRRFVTACGAGRILNPKTANSQMFGGVIWGIGQALHEESVVDPRWGNFVTRSFADYHVPANLDIGEIETIFVREEDKIVNKMGIKGIGEVGIVGVAAAVANAIFNATGKRVRDLPITPEKLI